MIGKQNNFRRNPGVKGRRPDKKAARVAVARENLARWRALSPREQLRELDCRLGQGVGAIAQRARIARMA